MNIKPANQSCLSIYMITSVPCRAVHLLLDVRGRGVPVDLLRHNGRARVHQWSGQRRSNKSKNKNSRGLGARQTGRIQNST